jgi:hypothetical protein
MAQYGTVPNLQHSSTVQYLHYIVSTVSCSMMSFRAKTDVFRLNVFLRAFLATIPTATEYIKPVES